MTRESFTAIAFDCDSTLSTLEGIDELAARKGCEAQIAPLTTAAMEGRLAIEEVYGQRLEVLRPSADDIAWLGQRYIDTIVPGAAEAIARLQSAGRTVFIVSGGLKAPVLALASHLNVATGNVHAVDVFFDEAGRYAGFERDSPLTRSNGKAIIASKLKAGSRSLALVGDGVTDIAARDGGAFVIGFGGVVRRLAVVAGADHFIDGPSLEAVADYLLG
jgi:phosphoserine phosphatase